MIVRNEGEGGGEARVTVLPPAKLNLYLEVLGKRPDGYHEIETVMQTIDLCDRLEVERTAGRSIAIETSGFPAPADATNLVAVAAEAFFAAAETRFGLAVKLQKNVPPGAGLGGGSSDAAGMLLALNTLAGGVLDKDRLSAAAARVGSDVPFFLTGGTAIARGRGERIEAIPDGDVPAFIFVVLFPRVTSPTPLVYKSLKSDLTTRKRNLHRFLEDLCRPFDRRQPPFTNALAEPFFAVFPAVARLAEEVARVSGCAFNVSGSGSALYAAVEDAHAGEEVTMKLQAMAAGDVFLTRSLSRDPNRRLGTPGLS